QGAFVSSFQFFPSVDDHTSFPASWPGSRPLYQPPMIHILFRKLATIGKSLCFQVACAVISSQWMPSVDFHTSRGGASSDLNQPPKIHINSCIPAVPENLSVARLPNRPPLSMTDFGQKKCWLPRSTKSVARFDMSGLSSIFYAK